MSDVKHRPRCPRIVLSGGPGGGKTTALDLFRREFGESTVIVPESATLLFSGGYPRYDDAEAVRATQRAIYHVQLGLEYAQAAQYPSRILLCDRGTIDGAAHWPDGEDSFFEEMDTTLAVQLSRYDAVLFFESAAVGGIQIEGGNPVRVETLEQAVTLDTKLRSLWCQHPYFVHISHRKSFVEKILAGVAALEQIRCDLHIAKESGVPY